MITAIELKPFHAHCCLWVQL